MKENTTEDLIWEKLKNYKSAKYIEMHWGRNSLCKGSSIICFENKIESNQAIQFLNKQSILGYFLLKFFFFFFLLFFFLGKKVFAKEGFAPKQHKGFKIPSSMISTKEFTNAFKQNGFFHPFKFKSCYSNYLESGSEPKFTTFAMRHSATLDCNFFFFYIKNFFFTFDN